MNTFRLILSLLPFTIFCLLLLFHRSASLLKISVATLLVTITIAVLFWSSQPPIIAFSLAKGIVIALDILLIIFGAILFLEILKKIGVTESLAFHLNKFSPDLRVQVILIAWFLENFIEGIAGFGTPCTIAVPLLIALGISPLNAIVISLLGNSTSVPFGAVGTPIRVGFSGINIDLLSIAPTASIFNFVGILVPVFMIWVLVSTSKDRFTLFTQALPFALWSGFAFVLPAFLISIFGIEFPSILGSILGLFLVIITSRLGFFVPKTIYRHSDSQVKTSNPLNLKHIVFPYALFILLLIIAKIYLANLYNPGSVFIITSIIVVIYSKVKWTYLSNILRFSFTKSIEPFLVIAAMSTVVQLMNNTASATNHLPSITQTISKIFDTQLLPLLAPFIGALGSFLTGSATVSNLMFAPSIHSSSIFLGLNPVTILSLTLVGAGAGNMIALADVLAAKSVAHDTTSLRVILLRILPYCLIYLTLVAIIGGLVTYLI